MHMARQTGKISDKLGLSPKNPVFRPKNWVYQLKNWFIKKNSVFQLINPLQFIDKLGLSIEKPSFSKLKNLVYR